MLLPEGESAHEPSSCGDAAVLISAEDLAELEETLSVLRNPDALAYLREADEAYRGGITSL